MYINPEITKTSKDKGFTLVELLIVIMILGILTSVAIPSYRSFVAGQRIKNASFDVMSMLTMSRSEAIKRNATVTATPVSADWALGWSITTGGGAVINQQGALPGITVSCFSGAPLAAAACSQIDYDRNGRSGNSQAIQITSASATGVSRCVSIDPSGRPNSKKGNC